MSNTGSTTDDHGLEVGAEVSLEDCPPADAAPASGVVYRCCKSNPPSADDLSTPEEKNIRPNADACRRKALSVFESMVDAEHQVRLFRNWKSKRVAKATLEPEHGRTLPTGEPTHMSWWPGELAPAD